MLADRGGLKLRAVALVVAVALVGCGGESGQQEAKATTTAGRAEEKAPPNAIVMMAAEKAVRAKLSDPETARFRNVVVREQASGTKAVCGEVNAKNKMGGYAGYEGFISAGSDELTWLASELEDYRGAWSQICAAR